MTRHNKRAAWFGRGAHLCIQGSGFLALIPHGPRVMYREYFKESDRRNRKAS